MAFFIQIKHLLSAPGGLWVTELIIPQIPCLELFWLLFRLRSRAILFFLLRIMSIVCSNFRSTLITSDWDTGRMKYVIFV